MNIKYLNQIKRRNKSWPLLLSLIIFSFHRKCVAYKKLKIVHKAAECVDDCEEIRSAMNKTD